MVWHNPNPIREHELPPTINNLCHTSQPTSILTKKIHVQSKTDYIFLEKGTILAFLGVLRRLLVRGLTFLLDLTLTIGSWYHRHHLELIRQQKKQNDKTWELNIVVFFQIHLLCTIIFHPKTSIHLSLSSSRIWTYNMEKELHRHVDSSGLYCISRGHWCIVAMSTQLVQRKTQPDGCHSVEVQIDILLWSK